MELREVKRWHRAAHAAALLAAVLAASDVRADEALARKNDCLGCHSVASKLVGPAYKDVAAKYAGQADAIDRLQVSIRDGSVGKWGDVPMPPHPKLAPATLKKLATWIMGLK
jgi:cytochrome c